MEWLYPASIDELLEIKGKYGKKAMVVAGGTSLGLNLPESVDYLVDISRVELSFIKIKEDFIEIGAGTTITDLIENRNLERVGQGLLIKAAKKVATHQLRNRITAGGNVVQVFPWCDLPPALLAINATFFTINSQGGFRTFSADQWFSKQPRSLLKEDEILYKIDVPIDSEDIRGDFVKFTLSEVEDTIITVSVYGLVKDNIIRDIRISVGGCEALPRRLNMTERMLVGKEINQKLIEELYTTAKQEIMPRWQDRRVEPVYKKEVGAVILQDIISNFKN